MADLRDPRVYDDFWDYLTHEGLMAPEPEVVDAWWLDWGLFLDGSQKD